MGWMDQAKINMIEADQRLAVTQQLAASAEAEKFLDMFWSKYPSTYNQFYNAEMTSTQMMKTLMAKSPIESVDIMGRIRVTYTRVNQVSTKRPRITPKK